MPNKVVLFLILDAFRWDYLDSVQTPCLWELAQKGIYARKLKSSPGFTQRSSIFTGTWPETSGNFTMFLYDPQISQYHYLKYLPFLELFEHRLPLVDMGLRWFLRKLNKYCYPGRYFPPAFIPFRMLPHIGISEDNVPIYKAGAFARLQSLFDVFEAEKLAFEFLMHPLAEGDDEWVFQKILSSSLQSGVIFAQFSESDEGIHKAGVGSLGAKHIIGKLDRRVASILKHFRTRAQPFELIIVGDHGMTNVEHYLDLDKHSGLNLASQGLEFGRDYLSFFSSTLAHYWCQNEQAKIAVRALLGEEIFTKHGFVLTPELCRKYRIPVEDRRYGNFIWAANQGVLIFPDYFHRYKRYRAMHGYITESDDMAGFALAYKSDGDYAMQKERAELVDICPTIAESIGVSVPSGSYGKSLYR